LGDTPGNAWRRKDRATLNFTVRGHVTETLSIIATLAGMIAFYILLAVGFLRLGAKLSKHHPRVFGSRFTGTVHVLALFAFLIGCLLAWMAYASDNPMKERQLFLPLDFVLIVYGVVLIIWIRTAGLRMLIRMLSSLFSGREG
jgi:NAD/NADP transhydrogenase beta subunit